MHYLSGTWSIGLLFQRSTDLSMSTYSDVDWASNIDDLKCVAAYCVFIGPNIVLVLQEAQLLLLGLARSRSIVLLPLSPLKSFGSCRSCIFPHP